ncbi:MAG: glutamate racemase, partial [Chloroflexota bacterium]|nr:glutamate racemase [Chloroflexota bacterium]
PDMDTLLLGCTHYPLLRGLIERILGPGVSVVDSAFTTALAVEDLLDTLGSRGPATSPPTRRVMTTGDLGAFRTVAQHIFGTAIPDIEPVRLAIGAGR